MTFSSGEKGKGQRSTEEELIDATLMQGLQDHFCDANNVYLVCVNRKHEVITKEYGSEEEQRYIHSIINREKYISLLDKLLDDRAESVLEEDCGTDLVKMCGVFIEVSGEAVIWIVIGIMEGKENDIPDYMMRTTSERYYKSLGFLETLSKQMFTVKMEELIAQEAFLKSRKSEMQMEIELHRNEAMTAIVKMLESERETDEIINTILRDICEYLDVSVGFMLKEDQIGKYVQACAYVSENGNLAVGGWKQRKKEELPFFNGKSHIISANCMMPDKFCQFFEKEEICAGIFMPIEVKGHATIYLCLCEKDRERIWDDSDIKFVDDVKRIIQSILIKRIVKNSLATSYMALEAILENVGCGIYVKDLENDQILYMNQRFRESYNDSIEQKWLEQHCAKYEEEGECFREIHLEEENYWFDVHCTYINWVNGKRVILCTIYDVTDKKLYQQKIENQENNDFLTGLYNRMRCERDLERYILQIKESGGEGALLYIDLDDFKHINDGLGHHYGDILLKNIADSLKNIPGVENSCYRMGGDEFIIILMHRQIHMLHQILEEVKTLFAKPWMLKDGDYYCTMSMGVVQFPRDGNTVEELIKKADIAMYEAKSLGKNCIHFYDENVESTSYERLDLEKNMRNATRNACEEFEVCYQPIFDLTREGNPCVGAEALLRWNSNKLGAISPSEFIPLAEYLGLINPIGEFVLKQASRSCKYWNDMGHPDYKVNVNLSVVQLLQKNITDMIRSVIKESGISPQNLTLEVTESLAINDMNYMKQILADIRSLGVRVALDDFGTGYSSLNHIREMPLDVIKIDRCFVTDIGKDEFQTAFVKMVAELASAINVNVCVEGVETREQFDAIKNTKIQMLQGFYLGKPMHRSAFERKFL